MGRFARIVTVVALASACAWVCLAPYLTVESMRRAAERGDADAVAKHIDFPAVRESLKRQMAARIDARIGSESGLGRLGAGLANAFAGPAIDTVVSPESLMLLFAGRELRDDMRQLTAPYPPSGEQIVDAGGIHIDDSRFSMGYEGVSTFSVDIETGASGGAPTKLLFKRKRLLWWTLSEVVLPASAASAD